jgi:hypothetical protein
VPAGGSVLAPLTALACPAAPARSEGRVGRLTPVPSWKFSKNVPAAKEFLMHLSDSWKDSMVGSRGYNMPFLKDAYHKPMPVIGTDPKLMVLQDFPEFVAFAGYPGPFSPAVQEVVATFVLPDMCTRVAKGQSPDDAIQWAMGEYRRIYAKHQRV